MAGRKQHFIPQHYQRAFATRESVESQIWLYRKGKDNAVKVNISDVAAQRDFYEKPNKLSLPTLDDLITDYEERLTVLVNEIRNCGAGSGLSTSKIAEVAAHLSIRAAYVREFVALGAASLIDFIFSAVETPEIHLDTKKIPMHTPPEYITSEIIQKLEKEGLLALTNVSKHAIARLLYFAIREDYVTLRDQAIKLVSKFVDELPFDLGGLSKEAHTKVLQDSLAPEKRRAELASLSWIIETHQNGNAVLPDCVVIAKDAKGWGAYSLSDSSTLECVVLAIAPNRLAVGRSIRAPLFTLSDYNDHAIKSCLSFFLTSTLDASLELAIANLGGAVRNSITKLTEEAGKTTITKLLRVDDIQPQQQAQNITWDQCLTTHAFSFSVNLLDFGDEMMAQKVGLAVKELVLGFSQILPARNLQGITFAVDYSTAVLTIDRGFEVTAKPTTGIPERYEGVAMPMLVRRNNQIKSHIVIHADIADLLISEDADDQSEAESVLYYCLSSVALSDLIDSKFPNVLMKQFPDNYDGWLASYTDSIFSVYFTNRVVSNGCNRINLFQRHAFQALEDLVVEARQANAEYKLNLDHNMCFARCATASNKLMYAMARLFGASYEFQGPFKEGQLFRQRLTTLKLDKWALLFEADLDRFHNRLEEWDDYLEINFLNRHFERLLFETGVLPDQLEGNGFYIHVSQEARIAEFDRAFREALN